MKLVRYGNPGKEKPGLIDADGVLRDLRPWCQGHRPGATGRRCAGAAAQAQARKLPLVKGSPRMGCPVAGIGKFIAIGLNYSDHAAEAGSRSQGADRLHEGHHLHPGPRRRRDAAQGLEVKSDWEVELGVVIGATARYVSQKGRAGRTWPATAWSTT
jgi:2,4-diketo-3-deoxy-L-fuconate hydrolase